MKYVFDTNSFRVLYNYFPERFPSFWENIDALVAADRIISVSEAYSELLFQAHGHLYDWIESNQGIFLPANQEETEFVAEIFKIPHFVQLVGKKAIANGTPVADPFIIASAKINGACVVTEEIIKEHAAKIPNACKHFSIPCTNLNGFMGMEGWTF